MSAELLGLAASVALLSYICTRQLALQGSRLAPLDHPNERSLHTAPTPRTGGLAILGSVAVGLLIERIFAWAGFSAGIMNQLIRMEEWWWIMGLVAALGIVSFWDDRAGLSPLIRLAFHGLAALGVVYGAGLVVTMVPLPIFGAFSLGWMAGPLTALGLMWMTNLYNFMDGMDGFAGGMTVLGFGVLGYLAFVGGAPDLALVAALITGAAGGFLFFNVPPARIFMGDIGSVPLGFLAGTLAAMGVRDGVFDLWVPLLIFSPFVVDATLTLFRRMLRGVKVWQAHREHYYQRLVLSGLGHQRTVAVEYGLMLACGVSAVVYGRVDEVLQLAILAGWVSAYLGLALAVGRIERQRN